MSSSEISMIYKSRNIILELMEKQNYKTDEYLGFSINEVNIMVNTKQLDMLLTSKTNEPKKDTSELDMTELDKTMTELQQKKITPEKKVYIKYFLMKSLRTNNIDEMVEDLFVTEDILTKNDTLLIITKDEINETIQNHLKQVWDEEKIYVIVLNIKKLQFNILNHVLVPPQRIMLPEEVEVIKKKYNIMDNTQWPEISRFDPVMMVLGIRPGEICEITRPNKCSIVEKYYRMCMNN
jgi:DNA-directed RNA polymerase subunit H (RpoH/RPB5)